MLCLPFARNCGTVALLLLTVAVAASSQSHEFEAPTADQLWSTPATVTNSTGSAVHTSGHWPQVIIVSLVLVCAVIAFTIERFALVWIPESCVFLTIGIIVGVILRQSSVSSSWANFDPTIFFIVLLPPIVLDNGYSMRKVWFPRKVFRMVLTSAAETLFRKSWDDLGLCRDRHIISTFIVGIGLLYLGAHGLSYTFSFAGAFAFGSLISAIDPCNRRVCARGMHRYTQQRAGW